MAKKPVPPPHLRAPYNDDDIRAIRALAAGNASETQQKRALNWIVNGACGYYELSFQSGPDSAQVTAFAEGRRYAGAQVVKLTKLVPESNG